MAVGGCSNRQIFSPSAEKERHARVDRRPVSSREDQQLAGRRGVLISEHGRADEVAPTARVVLRHLPRSPDVHGAHVAVYLAARQRSRDSFRPQRQLRERRAVQHQRDHDVRAGHRLCAVAARFAPNFSSGAAFSAVRFHTVSGIPFKSNRSPTADPSMPRPSSAFSVASANLSRQECTLELIEE